jgi:hypothetical protein
MTQSFKSEQAVYDLTSALIVIKAKSDETKESIISVHEQRMNSFSNYELFQLVISSLKVDLSFIESSFKNQIQEFVKDLSLKRLMITRCLNDFVQRNQPKNLQQIEEVNQEFEKQICEKAKLLMALRSKSQFVIEETSCLRVIEGN